MSHMGMSLGMQTQQRQEMRLAPRMIQSMEILQLPIMELKERVEQELQENPVLEEADEVELPEPIETTETEPNFDPDGPMVTDADNQADFNRLEEINRDWENHFNEEHRPSRGGMDEESDRKHDAMQNMPTRPPSLHDHLAEQLAYLDADPEQYELLTYVISHLADNGWLGAFVDKEPDDEKKNGRKKKTEKTWVPHTLEDLVANYSKPVSLHEMEGALAMIQRLDPPGVGARDLKECLLLQLTPDMPQHDLLRVLILDHLEDLDQNRLPIIEKKTGHSVEEILEARELLKSFNTHPGSIVSAKDTQYINPDVVVERNDKGDYDVRLTDDWLPEIRISRQYIELARQKGLDPKTKDFLRRKINSAEWLADAIRQRRNTLERVTRAIVEHQRAFLDLGPEHIRPLKMQQIADQVKVHVTTVSRAVDDKWAQTPRGVFPLKRFFVGGAENQLTNEDVAYETIRNKLLEMIGAEDKTNPLSDDELVKKLNEAGFPVKRRTVTKYRMMLNIPSSRQRKDWTK
jgi:RNA polymerase sigma-54 factor